MRKLITVLAVSSATAFLCVPAAHADEAVGGSRLAAHGYVWDHSAGVPAPPHIQASSYVIADLETGRVLAAKDPHGHYRPASTLKTLTAITLIPRLDPAKKVHPSRAAVDVSGSAVGLDTHWTYTVADLFYGLLMQSGNDAAIALSEANGGLRPTLDEMNAEARRIRALDTVAGTPNGLDDDPPLTLAQQHSSAYDLALVMKQGLKLPGFRKYVARTLYDWPAPPTKKERAKGKKTGGWEIGTHDHLLLGNRYPGMVGGKNGWTSHALGSFVGAATRDGHTIIIALMHAQSDFWPDARSLLDWGFDERAKAAGVGTLVDPVPPPRPVRPQAAAGGRHGALHATSGGGAFTWWPPVAAGAGGAAVLAAVAGLVVGIRRRRRPAAASPPPTPSSGPPSYDPPSSDRPPSDLPASDAPSSGPSTSGPLSSGSPPAAPAPIDAPHAGTPPAETSQPDTPPAGAGASGAETSGAWPGTGRSGASGGGHVRMIPPVRPPTATPGSPTTPAGHGPATAPEREPAVSADSEGDRADDGDGDGDGTHADRSSAAEDGSRASRPGRHRAGEPVVRDAPPDGPADRDDTSDEDDQPVR